MAVEEPAHDVLAADEFAMPAPDPALRHGPIRLPDDPTGIAEPHDVLAAEEFPMPAARHTRSPTLAERTEGWRNPAAAIGAAIAVLLLLRALVRRR